MATLGYAARVGLVVIIAAVLVGFMYNAFKGISTKSYELTVLFDDASGITNGSFVQWAGVQIGSVSDVKLAGQRAQLTLKIEKQYHIPLNSQFEIVTPVLGTTGVINVVPPPDAPKHPNDVIHEGAANIEGSRAGDIQASLKNVNDLLDHLTVTTDKANKLLDSTTRLMGDPRMHDNLIATVANVKAMSANGIAMTSEMQDAIRQDNARIQALLGQTQNGAHAALNNITDTTAEIKATTHANREKIDEIVANLRDTTAAVAGITEQTNDLLKNGGVAKNLASIVNNLNSTTAKLDAITGEFQKLSSDKGMQGDLKDTVHNIRETTELTRLLVERLGHLAGVKSKPSDGTASPASTPSVGSTPMLLPRVQLMQNTRDDRFRMDMDAIIPLGGLLPNSFLVTGIYGLGDQNKLNLQMGRHLNRAIDYRAGLHASQLSIGGDIGLGRDASLSADLYNVNNSHLDAHGTFMLSPQLGLLVGGEDLTRHPGAVVGVEYRR